MSEKGAVVYSAGEGYDADAWDDSSLIKAYDRAMQSSRELIRVRKGGSKGSKKTWEVGQACRAVWEEDGEEYEGTVVEQHPASRAATVRFHGYNNEARVKCGELMESQGQEAVEEQIDQARRDEEVEEEEEEEPGAGDDFNVGDWCRAEYSEDGVVYEAVVEKVDMRRGTAWVKFVGFGNKEEKELEQLFMSKGEEWRDEQEKLGRVEAGEIKEEELHNLIAQNCPDLLANFGEAGDTSGAADIDLALENLGIKEEVTPKRKGKEKKSTKLKKSSSQSTRGEASIKGQQTRTQSSYGQSSQQHPGYNNSMPSMPHSMGMPSMPHSMGMPSMPSSMGMPSIPSSLGMPTMPPSMSMPQISSYMGWPPMPSPMGMMPPMGMPHDMFPAPTLGATPYPHPDHLDQAAGGDPALKALLLSWFNAGYHSGFYQRTKTGAKSEKSAKKKSS